MMLRVVVVSVLVSGCASLPGFGSQAARRDSNSDEAAAAALREKLPSRREPTLKDLLLEGDRSRNAGSVAGAAWTYVRAMRLAPASSLPEERIGFLHLASGDPKLAQAAFELAASNDPESAMAHCGLGLAHLALGSLDRAEAPLLRAVELAPNDWLPLLALGVLEDGRAMPDRARAHYARALEIAPNNPDIHNDLGLSYLMEDDFERAAIYLRRAFELAPENAVTRNNLGLTLGRLGRYDEALTVFRSSANEAQAQNNLGYVYFLNEDYAGAIRHYELALTSNPSDRLPIIRNLRQAENARDRVSAIDATDVHGNDSPASMQLTTPEATSPTAPDVASENEVEVPGPPIDGAAVLPVASPSLEIAPQRTEALAVTPTPESALPSLDPVPLAPSPEPEAPISAVAR